jgi:ABC-type Mn2+/Zn2+ transport system ATPase subunit
MSRLPGVDVKTEKAMIDLLIELRQQGHTILISTHDLSSIETFCDQVVLVNKTILAYGSQQTCSQRKIWHVLWRGNASPLKKIRLGKASNGSPINLAMACGSIAV